MRVAKCEGIITLYVEEKKKWYYAANVRDRLIASLVQIENKKTVLLPLVLGNVWKEPAHVCSNN